MRSGAFLSILVTQLILDFERRNFEGITKLQINDPGFIFFWLGQKKLLINNYTGILFESGLEPWGLNLAFLRKFWSEVSDEKIQIGGRFFRYFLWLLLVQLLWNFLWIFKVFHHFFSLNFINDRIDHGWEIHDIVSDGVYQLWKLLERVLMILNVSAINDRFYELYVVAWVVSPFLNIGKNFILKTAWGNYHHVFDVLFVFPCFL